MKIHGVELDPVSAPLNSLHQGQEEKPLAALGRQELQQGGAMDSTREPKGMGRSVAKKMAYAEKAKSEKGE